MTTITKDLGPVTAYAYAVEGGYTGTEEEFTEALGEAVDAVDQIANLSAEATTLSAGSSATASYDDGVITFGIPKGDKGDTGNSIASISKTSTSGIVDTYTITYTGGQSSDTFTVTNGNGITNITLNNDYTLTITTNTGSYTTSESIRGETGNGISDISKTGTSGNVDTYTITFTDGNSTTFEVTNGNVSSVNGRTGAVTGLAENDGYYQQMTVGNAEQLVSTVFIEDKTPYTFRTSGGSADIGDREYDEIVGGTVAWNQMQANTASKTLAGVTYTYSNGELTVSNTATANSWWLSANDTKWNFIAGHVYYFHIGAEDYAYVNGEPYWYIPGGFNALNPNSSFILNTNNTIKHCEFDTVQYMQFMVPNGKSVSATFMPQCFDLTQMFGSTIADYIYTLEQNTPGSGVAWFKKLFPKDYYPYNAGTLLSVNASAHKMVGFNAYEHANTSAKVVGGNQYQITGTYTSISLDGTAVTPDSDGYFTPSVSGTLSVVGGNATDTCIHLVWDGERDGEYEPYEVHNYPLDSSLTLRGIPKLDAGNNLYYDGDTYEADGTVTRRYGIVDLGSLSYSKSSIITNGFVATAGMPDDFPLAPNSLAVPSWVCSNYQIYSNIGIEASDVDKAIAWRISNQNKGVIIRDNQYASYYTNNDMASFKTAMSGVYLVYELITPTTDSADPFASPQIVNDFGTEEYVVTEQDGVAVPVGHITKYANNLRAKLEMAPDSPPGDGEYIVKQTDGQNEYVPLASSSIIVGIQGKLPSAPAEDGTYLLNATVNGSTNTYAWSQGSVSELESDIARNTFYILDLYNKISEVPSTATYNEIASVVQNGDAPRLFKIGSQITANYNDGTNSYVLPWDIVACRDIVDANGVTKPGMIIQSHYAMQECQFDQNEGFFVVPAGGFSANTFHFTMGNTWGSNVVKDKVYQFTTTEDYAEGDIWQLGKATSEISGLPDTSPSNWRVRTYKAANGVSAGAVASATEILTLSEGSGGTDLGTLSSSTKYGTSGLNNMQRAAYGYNRWGQSGIRQWLNSSAAAGAWWTSQNPYDRAPLQLSSMRGFMAGFDNDFLSIIKPVTITTALNTVTDTDIGASETTVDTFFLPSLEEEYIVPQVSGVEGAYWPYWKDRLGLSSPQGTGSSYANTNHIGYRYDSKTSAVYCRLRSAYRLNAYSAWYVNSSGHATNNYATYSYRPRPACIIY